MLLFNKLLSLIYRAKNSKECHQLYKLLYETNKERLDCSNKCPKSTQIDMHHARKSGLNRYCCSNTRARINPDNTVLNSKIIGSDEVIKPNIRHGRRRSSASTVLSKYDDSICMNSANTTELEIITDFDNE